MSIQAGDWVVFVGPGNPTGLTKGNSYRILEVVCRNGDNPYIMFWDDLGRREMWIYDEYLPSGVKDQARWFEKSTNTAALEADVAEKVGMDEALVPSESKYIIQYWDNWVLEIKEFDSKSSAEGWASEFLTKHTEEGYSIENIFLGQLVSFTSKRQVQIG